jgi:hypothetical protein
VAALAFVIVRRVLGLVGRGPAPDGKDVEIAVLRHQLMVVRREVARPRYTPQDPIVLAMLARLQPRQRWAALLVTPATLLRWHRQLVAYRFAYPRIGRGRRGVDPQIVDLAVRMARENPRWAIPADRGGVPQARYPGVRQLGTPDLAPAPAGSRAAPRRSGLDRVLAGAGPWHARATSAVCSVWSPRIGRSRRFSWP